MKTRWWGWLLLAHSGAPCAALLARRSTDTGRQEVASVQPHISGDREGDAKAEWKEHLQQEKDLRRQEQEDAASRIDKVNQKNAAKAEEGEGQFHSDGFDEIGRFSNVNEDYYTRYDELERAKQQAFQGTDEGRIEAPTHTIGWLAPTAEVRMPGVGCIELCTDNSYCWQGKCVYRPWYYSEAYRHSCYADPAQPGLEHDIKSECQGTGAIQSETACLQTNMYCRWLNDAPGWYRTIVNEKERDEYKEWKKEQKEVAEDNRAEQGVKRVLSYAAPGNPIWGSVLSSPERRFMTDRGTR